MSSAAMNGPATGMAALSPVVHGFGFSGIGGTGSTDREAPSHAADWLCVESVVRSMFRAESSRAGIKAAAPLCAATLASPVQADSICVLMSLIDCARTV